MLRKMDIDSILLDDPIIFITLYSICLALNKIEYIKTYLAFDHYNSITEYL